MQVQDDCEIQPPLAGPDVTDVARPFLLRPGRTEVAIQKVSGDVERVIAVACNLELACSLNGDPVLRHSTPNPAMAYITDDMQKCYQRKANEALNGTLV